MSGTDTTEKPKDRIIHIRNDAGAQMDLEIEELELLSNSIEITTSMEDSEQVRRARLIIRLKDIARSVRLANGRRS